MLTGSDLKAFQAVMGCLLRQSVARTWGKGNVQKTDQQKLGMSWDDTDFIISAQQQRDYPVFGEQGF